MRWQRTTDSSGFGASGLDMKQHLAVYGNVYIERGRCPSCKRSAFIIDGKFQCCDRRVAVEPKGIKRICSPENQRRLPSLKERQRILEDQHYRCLYCGVSLVGYVTHGGELKRVRLTWDHMAAYALTQNNHHDNFAATCQFCNAWKSSLIFKTVEEVQQHVAIKWEGKNSRPKKVPRVRREIFTETRLAKVLQPKVSVPIVEPRPSAHPGSRRRCVYCYAQIEDTPKRYFCNEGCRNFCFRFAPKRYQNRAAITEKGLAGGYNAVTAYLPRR